MIKLLNLQIYEAVSAVSHFNQETRKNAGPCSGSHGNKAAITHGDEMDFVLVQV